MIATTCARCGVETSNGMTSAVGTVCPDCYDLVADGEFSRPATIVDNKRGVRFGSDGRTMIVSIRYEDTFFRRVVKELGFRWNDLDKTWRKVTNSPAEAGRIARELVAAKMPVLDNRVMIATGFGEETAPATTTVESREVSFDLTDDSTGRTFTVTAMIPAVTATDIRSELRAAGAQIAAEFAKVIRTSGRVTFDDARVWPGNPNAAVDLMVGKHDRRLLTPVR